MATDLKIENQRLRKELREETLRAEGWRLIAIRLRGQIAHFARIAIAEPDLNGAISDYKYKQEPSLHFHCSVNGSLAGRLPNAAADGVYALLGADPMKDTPSLVDLSFFTRAAVAAVDGVGAKTMEFLDAAMADAGLSWAEPEAVV